MGRALDETGLACLDQCIDNVDVLGDEFLGAIIPFSPP